MMETDSESVSGNLIGWKITSLTPNELKISLTFSKSIEVSQGEEKDSLLVFLDLSQFSDKDGLSFAEFLFLKSTIPFQNPSAEEIAAVETAATVTSTSTTSVLSTNFIAKHVAKASMNSLWSLLNSVQIIAFAPMFESLKFPNNASAFNKGLVEVATYDIIPTQDWIDPLIIGRGLEGEPFSYNFEQCGFESTHILSNSSVILWLYALNGATLVFFIIVVVFHNRTGCLASLKSKLQGYFVFNGPLRLFMETFFDLYLTAVLNVFTADKSTESAAERASANIALGFFFTFSSLVVILAILYTIKFSRINADSNYGALLDGTNADSRWSLLFPAFFFGRRIAFTLSVILMPTFLAAQIAIQFAFSIAMIIYLGHA